MAPKLNIGIANPQIIAWATRREENHEEHEPIVAALIDAGVDPTIMDCNGNTAL
jgi:ankyrin repeat protein